MTDCGCDEEVLSDAQLRTLVEKSPAIDAAVAPLPQALQAKLLILQQRAGDAYAAGEWTVEGKDEKHIVPMRSRPPTAQEAQEALGQAYLALEDKKTQLKGVMDAMELTPSSRPKGWIGQMVENVKGLFR